MSVIIKCLFLPIFMCGILGVLWVISRYRKERLFMIGTRLVVVVLTLELSARCFFPESSRYYSFLIFPCVVAAAYFLTELPRRFFVLATIVLVISCLGKIFHGNPYADYLQQAAEAMKSDAVTRQWPVLVDFSGQGNVLQHYSGIKVVNAIPGKSVSLRNELKKNFSLFANRGDAVYFIEMENAEKPLITAKELKLPDSQWTLLYSSFTNRKEKRQLAVYRYCCPSIKKVWDAKGVSEYAKKYRDGFLKNGDFELVGYSPEAQRNAEKISRNGNSFLQRHPAVQPADWSAEWSLGFSKNAYAEIEITNRRALIGKKSLRLKSFAAMALQSEKFQKEPGQYSVHFLGKASNDTSFFLYIYEYDREGRFQVARQIGYGVVYHRDLAEYSFPWTIPAEAACSGYRVCLGIEEGEMFFDGISIHPDKITETVPVKP